jgi:hypothetical protein
VKRRSGGRVTLGGMGRWLALCSLAGGLLASARDARGEDDRPLRSVVIVAPSAASCVLADPLLVGIMNAGPFFASLVPASSVPETIPAATFQLEGTPQALHVRAWGLSSTSSKRQTRPEVDQLISDQSCETVTEAVVAQVVSLLAPDGFDTLLVDEPAVAAPAASTPPPGALEQLLDDARRELGARPDLSAGVFSTTLGLELAVQDQRGRCRRATWLQTSQGKAELGMSLEALTGAVDGCLAALPPEPARPAPASETARGDFHLGLLAGSLAASMGLINGLVVAEGSASTATAVLYGAAPPVIGGVASYLVSPRWREPVLLTGYWLGVAGTSMVVATESGASKTLLVGGSISAGSMTSAALAIFNGLIDQPSQRIAAWAVATPAVVGAGLGAASLTIEGDGQDAASLALYGGLTASLPALWLAGVALVGGDERPPVDVAVVVDDPDAASAGDREEAFSGRARPRPTRDAPRARSPRVVLHGEF